MGLSSNCSVSVEDLEVGDHLVLRNGTVYSVASIKKYSPNVFGDVSVEIMWLITWGEGDCRLCGPDFFSKGWRFGHTIGMDDTVGSELVKVVRAGMGG